MSPQGAAQAARASATQPVQVQYTGGCDPLINAHQVTGKDTGYNYGLVQCGDIINIWLADLVVMEEVFNPL